MLDENDSTTTSTPSEAVANPGEPDGAPEQQASDAPVSDGLAPDSPAPQDPVHEGQSPDDQAADGPGSDSPAPATAGVEAETLTEPGDVVPVRKTARKATRKVGARTTRQTAASPAAPVDEDAVQGAEPSVAQASGVDAAQATGTDVASSADAISGADVAADSLESPAVKKTARKSAAHKTSAHKTSAQKTSAQKATAEKATAKKAATKKVTNKKATTKRAASKKAATAPDGTAEGLPELEAQGGLDAQAAAPSELRGGDQLAVSPEVDAEDNLDAQPAAPAEHGGGDQPAAASLSDSSVASETAPEAPRLPLAAPSLLFQAPDPVAAPKRTRRRVGSSPVPATESASPASTSGPDLARSTDPDAEPDSGRTTQDTNTDPDRSTGPDDSTLDTSKEASTSSDIDGRPEADGKPSTDPETDGKTADEPDDTRDTDDEQGVRRRRRRGGRRRRRSGGSDGDAEGANDTEAANDTEDTQHTKDPDASSSAGEDEAGQDAPSGGRQGGRRSGQRGGRNAAAKDSGPADSQGNTGPEEPEDSEGQDESTGSRRRRRRRRTGEEGEATAEEPNTVVRVRKPRTAEDEITSLHGSTRLEAKKQRRREGREAGRRRAPIVSEAEFLARREAVDRVMVIRQREDLTQIAVLEDKVLVEHYVARESQTSLIGNVYLGRVQNVLPSMEAAFIDIGKGRNAVLYAGEVNWDSLGAGNGPRKIEQVLKSGQPILVQVSKDPIGHKGARLTSQISLPGRFLVYVPDGTTSGISRKLPDTERSRLKALLKEIVPDSAGVIVRTAAEGASEDELTLDVERLTARWADIESKVEKSREKGGGPQLLYGEPDLTLKVVRDLFTEDFAKLVIAGDEAWDLVNDYVEHVAPDLAERLERYADDEDVFGAYRVDEQIAKGLDRKVWLPSGGSLVIDRTEAMTVVDVNTGKFTGSGGNLEETVTKNNLEAAEEMVRQLRLRDIGGIIVIDFIDMVLESNRDLVLRRLVECLGRDRTRHQVAEVTSLGLVQMTRKRIGTGLVESFSENCEHCQGRGVVIHHEPVEPRRQPDEEPRRGRRGRGRGEGEDTNANPGRGGGGGRSAAPVVGKPIPSPMDIAAIAKHEPRPVPGGSELPAADVPLGAVPDQLVPAEEPVAGDAAPIEPVASELPAPPEPPEAAQVGLETTDESHADQPQAPSKPAPTIHVDGFSPRPSPASVPETDGVPVAPREVDAVAEPAPGADSGPTAGEPTPSTSEVLPPVAAPVPAGPRLVTSTRRRVARRPAGPPTGGSGDVGTRDGEGDGSEADGGTAADFADDGAFVGAGRPQPEQAHVPVKRRGRR